MSPSPEASAPSEGPREASAAAHAETSAQAALSEPFGTEASGETGALREPPAQGLEAEVPFRRLHPTTLVQRVIMRAPAFALALLPILGGQSDRAGQVALTLALGVAVLTVPGIVLGYLRFRYRLTPSEVEIYSGVLARQHRSIPLDRIQRVEIDRPLVPRLFGTARVRLMTGGGAGAEGSLEYVALAEAVSLRADVRRLQEASEEAVEEAALPYAEASGPAPPSGSGLAEGLGAPGHKAHPSARPAPALAFRLTPGLLLRAGAMRFSLVYIALAYSGLQITGVDPEDIALFLTSERVVSALPLLTASPWLAAGLTLGFAVVLSWTAGLLMTVVRYYGFTLRVDERRLYTERGLGSRFERAVPRGKVQAVRYASNPLTRYFGYARLEVQTMGVDAGGDGQETLAPLARLAEASGLGAALFGRPHAEGLQAVSRRFIRRRGLRYSAAALASVAAVAPFWPEALWGLAGLPLGWALARAQWRAHGYRLDPDALVVQRGALWRRQWHLPVAKFQAVETRATLFQARQGLASVYVDTAGAPGGTGPTVDDLPSAEAAALARALREAYAATAPGLREGPGVGTAAAAGSLAP